MNFQHLTKAEEAVITQFQIGPTKATKAHILSRGPMTTCHYSGQMLTIDHMLLECAVLHESHDKYYTADSFHTISKTVPKTCIVKFLQEARFVYLIGMVRSSIKILNWIIPKVLQLF